MLAGFIASFLWTRDYNARQAGASTQSETRTAAGGRDIGSQQQMMAAVRSIIEKAKNNPRDFEAQVAAASAFDQIGRAAETVDYLKKAYEIDPQEAARQQIPEFIAEWSLKERKYDDAETWFRTALQHDPSNPDILRELGTTFLEREPPDVDKGIQYIQSALKAKPNDSHTLLHLVQAHLMRRDAEQADAALRRMKEIDPTDQNIRTLEAEVEALKAGRPVRVPKE